MERVSIIGCPGSGKSYFARQLHAKTKLPLVHLDREYHSLKFGKDSNKNRSLWKTRLRTILSESKWITDGNYFSTQNERLASSDAIFVFNFPKRIVYWRILKRRFTYRNTKRPDMPDTWKERLSVAFIRSHVIGFDKKYQETTAHIISSLDQSIEVHFFKHPREVKRYLRGLK